MYNDPDIIECLEEIIDEHCTGCGEFISGAEDGDECPLSYWPEQIRAMREGLLQA
jgi:hypothetical protein